MHHLMGQRAANLRIEVSAFCPCNVDSTIILPSAPLGSTGTAHIRFTALHNGYDLFLGRAPELRGNTSIVLVECGQNSARGVKREHLMVIPQSDMHSV